MEMQYFLKLLWIAVEKKYKEKERIIDPDFKWTRDGWISLSIDFDDYVASNPLQIQQIKQTLGEKNRKKGYNHETLKLSVSDSTLERIYKTIYDKVYTPEEYYSVQEPSSVKRTTLDILSAYAGFENWNDFTHVKFHLEDIQRELIIKHIEVANEIIVDLNEVITPKNLPLLAKYFITTGSAYRNIELTCYHNRRNSQEAIFYKLRQYTMHDLTINYFSNKKAIVSTSEAWQFDYDSKYDYLFPISIQEKKKIWKNQRPSNDFDILRIRSSFDNTINEGYYVENCRLYTAKEFVQEYLNRQKKYIYVLFSNGEDWRIEGKYLSEKSYNDILNQYREPLKITIPVTLASMFNQTETLYEEEWHRLIVEDYILPFD